MAYKILMPQSAYRGDYTYLNTRVCRSAVALIDEAGNAIEDLFVPYSVTSETTIGYKVSVGVGGDFSKEVVSTNRLDFCAPPLGYINKGNTCVFTFRDPMRQWFQGHTRNNIGYSYLRNLSTPYLDSGCFYKPLLQPALNTYPNSKVVLEAASSLADAGAISRNFAVCCKFRLYYRNEEVGKVNSENGKMDLYKNFEYLREAASEELKKEIGVLTNDF